MMDDETEVGNQDYNIARVELIVALTSVVCQRRRTASRPPTIRECTAPVKKHGTAKTS
jgi:hypothetical protein